MNHSSFSVSPVDNNVQAPLDPSVLTVAIDLPLPLNTNESDDEPRSRGGRTSGSTSAKSSTTRTKGKPNHPGRDTDEVRKKLGKLFKGLGQSEALFLPIKPKLTISRPIRDIGHVG